VSELGEAAIALAELGYHIFPVRPRDKRPLTQHGFKDATRDERTLLGWWDKCPDANIGIACGPSEIVILDVDPKAGGDPEDVLAERDTAGAPIVHTGEAPEPDEGNPDSLAGVRGAHVYFRGDLSGTDKLTIDGAETRGRQHYVIAPPSRHPSGVAYEGELPSVAELPPVPKFIREAYPTNNGNGQAPPVDEIITEPGRNQALTSLGGSMRRRGMTPDEIATALKAVNVSRCRPPLAEVEVEKIAASVGRYEAADPIGATSPVQVDQPAPAEGAQSIPFAAIARERVRFLVRERVPLGMVTLLIGDPGLGKSLLTCMIAGEVSKAGGTSLMLTAEDSPSATVRPRLEAVEADLDRVRLVEVRREGVSEGLALPDDIDTLDGLVKRDQAVLVTIDPLTAHLPESVNSWRDQSVRRALAPLARMAAERRCAVVVVAHLNKARGSDALHRTGGSIGLPAACRSALLLARDPEDPEADRGSRRVLAHVKSNVSQQAQSLAFEVKPIELPGDEAIRTARLALKGTSHVNGGDLLEVLQGQERAERDEAADFLRELLKDEPKPSKDVKAATAEAGLGWKTVERAKTVVGVVVKRESDGFGGSGKWTWELPLQDRHSQDRHPYISAGGGLVENVGSEPQNDSTRPPGNHKTAKTATSPARGGETLAEQEYAERYRARVRRETEGAGRP
jgi:Bifunctional DNA primase/polymerase, N-terminal/AAA domain/Primase C terminal 1 (PriCT-1)